MEHLSEQACADLVRGINPKNVAAVKLHLASGCRQCAATLDFWKRLQTAAVNETTYIPPENIKSLLKMEFASRHFQNSVSQITAKLAFDTFSQPALAGVRSVAAAARQMVYEADGVIVDLRFDAPSHSTNISLIGQVLDTRAPRGPLDDASVILWTERGLPIAETKTNGHGEFNLEFEKRDGLRLSIQAAARMLIRIPLASLQATEDVDEGPGSN